MNQADRDRLVALKKAKKKLITQKEAAEELRITERQVRRLLKRLKKGGDKAVLHALRGETSNRKMPEEVQQRAVEILSQEVYRGFRPTLATEYLNEKHEVEASRETVRSAGGVLHRSGGDISDGGENQTRRATGGKGPAGNATHADRAGAEGTGDHLDSGVLSAGQRTRGTILSNCAGPLGERVARGRREHAGASQ